MELAWHVPGFRWPAALALLVAVGGGALPQRGPSPLRQRTAARPASPPHPVSSTAPIVGSVLREGGGPVPRATVMLSAWSSDPSKWRKYAPYRTTTDERGRFSLPAAALKNPQARVMLLAFAEGLAAASVDPKPGPGEMRLFLRPETQLPVRVADQRGAAVEGVRLLLWGGMLPAPAKAAGSGREPVPILYGANGSELLAPPTDARGQTVIRHLPRGGWLEVRVRDPKWVEVIGRGAFPQRVSLADAARSPDRNIVVQPAASVTGRVVTESGRPLPGQQVQVDGTDLPGVGTTDTRGEFRIEGLAPGSHNVQVGGPPFGWAGELPGADYVLPENLSLSLKPGEQRHGYTIVCPRGSLVSGRVVRADNRKPVAGAGIMVFESDMGFGMATSDAAGRFRFRIRPGSWRVEVQPPAGYDDYYGVMGPGQRHPELQTKSRKDYPLGDLPIVIRPLRTLRGSVLNTDGTPAAGATVYYPSAGGDGGLLAWTPHVTAGRDGRFVIRKLPPRGGCLLRAWKGPYRTESDVPIDLSREDRERPVLRLVRGPLATLYGRVEDDRGEPIAEAIVNVGPVLFGAHRAAPPFPTTDAQGRYQFDVWPGDRYTLHATAAAHGLGYLAPFAARSGDNRVPPIVLLRARSFLDLLIVDSEGKPLPDATASFQIPSGYPFLFDTWQTSDAKGRIQIEHVLPGQYQVQVTVRDGENYRYGYGEITAGQRDVRITVGR